MVKAAKNFATSSLVNQPTTTETESIFYSGMSTPIAPPEDRTRLKNEIDCCETLGETQDQKKILLFHCHTDSVLMKEIGRLREESFRLIGEGTGQARDIDQYDLYYMHIVLWDEKDQQVVGAYRLCSTCEENLARHSGELYTESLFEYLPKAHDFLSSGLELGRSFVQEKYWGTKSLEYLWYGISAFLRRNPQYRYLLGAVSISNTLSSPAQDLIVGYYHRYYGSQDQYMICKNPYSIGVASQCHIDELFKGQSTKEAFVTLKKQLRYLGFAVPVFYKQYAELTKPEGTRFLGFNIDPSFNDCVDGLVVVDIDQMSDLKRKRYGLLEHRLSTRVFDEKTVLNAQV